MNRTEAICSAAYWAAEDTRGARTVHAPRRGARRRGRQHQRSMATLGQPSGDQRPNPDEAPVTRAQPGDEIDMAFLLRDVPTSPPNTTGLPLGPMASLAARARGESANQRLHARWAGFDQPQETPVVANAAIARELAVCAGRWPSSTTDPP